ncbi:MAG TPA: hypothetical protein VF270_07220 [Ignavibacteriaceae bacterium]
MKKLFICIIINCIVVIAFGQNQDNFQNNMTSSCSIGLFRVEVGACNYKSATYDLSGAITFTNPPDSGQLIVRDCSGNQQIFNPPFTNSLVFNISGISITSDSCYLEAYFTSDSRCNTVYNYKVPSCSVDSCQDCISSFSPAPGKYIMSAWVKGDVDSVNTSYSNPQIKVFFNTGTSSYSLHTVGNIIGGWQQMRGLITVPTIATDIYIKLSCESGDCFFDDVRFLPTDASMKSYVYNPSTGKMMAVLDGRNYAVFYQYDNSGKLIRVNKETERGIKTIKESRNHFQINQ